MKVYVIYEYHICSGIYKLFEIYSDYDKALKRTESLNEEYKEYTWHYVIDEEEVK